MSDEILPPHKSYHTQNKDGSIVTHPEGHAHSVQRQARNPDGSWRMIYEISKEISMTLPALEKGERYMIICNNIFEFVHY